MGTHLAEYPQTATRKISREFRTLIKEGVAVRGSVNSGDSGQWMIPKSNKRMPNLTGDL